MRELEEETGLVGTEPTLLMVMGDPDRDPRKHIVSVVYEIQVSDDQTPTAGDDAADAKFWPIETVFSGELTLAGDHLQILTNWLKPKFSNVLFVRSQQPVRFKRQLKFSSGLRTPFTNSLPMVTIAKIRAATRAIIAPLPVLSSAE